MKKVKIEIKWGLIFVLAILVWNFLEKVVGFHGTHIDKHPIVTNLFLIPAFIIFAFGLKDKRDNFYGGSITYLQGFITGLIITAVVAVLAPLTQYIISTIITPDYFNNAIEYSVREGKMDRETAEHYFNLKKYIIMTTLFTPILGIITSGIVALFIKKKASG